MKFTQNTPIISPNTIGNVQVQTVRDPMAYGMGGKDYDAMAGALGQMAKVAQKQQDDADAADLMELRNKVMTSLTANLYGENGVLTTGVGENAKGLQGRVTDVVQKTSDSISQQYNRRVQRAFRGTFNENMANYQRIAAQQENREFQKQQESQYVLGVQNQTDLAMMNYQDENILQSSINEALRLADYRSHTMGYTEQQRQQERRNVITQVAGNVIDACIQNNDLETASIYNDRYGKYMDQKTVLKYQQTLRREKNIQDEKAEIDEIIGKFRKPDGTIDRVAAMDEIRRRSKLTKTVGGGSGSYSGDKNLDALIDKYAAKYHVPADLLAAMGDVESNFNMGAVSRVGALGVMQLMPDTAASLGVDPNSLEGNIEGGAKYLRQMLDTFGGDEDLAIAAYNAGPRAVKDAGNRIPNFKETQNHVVKVRDARKKYKGRVADVSFDKLDDDIDASGVQLDGTQPQTIGMINKANQIYKRLFGRNDFWVSCTVTGHDPNSPHAQGLKADVGGSALAESKENRDKFQAALQAEGIGANNEYDNKSDGWTGPHFDLDSRGKNWLTGENFGGFGVNRGGGHTVNLHDSGYENRMLRLLKARCQDEDFRLGEERRNKFENYKQQVNSLGAEGSVELIQRLKDANEDEGIVRSLAGYVNYKYNGVLNIGKGRSSAGGGARGGSSKEKIDGVTGLYGKDGSWIWMDKYNEKNDYLKRYHERVEEAMEGRDTVTPEEHEKAAKIGHELQNYWDANYDKDKVAAADKAWNHNRGNYMGAVNELVQETGMTMDEAARYVTYYLRHAKTSTTSTEEG